MPKRPYPRYQHRHNAVLLAVCRDPARKQKDIAKATGYSPSQVSRILCSPDFQQVYDLLVRDAASEARSKMAGPHQQPQLRDPLSPPLYCGFLGYRAFVVRSIDILCAALGATNRKMIGNRRIAAHHRTINCAIMRCPSALKRRTLAHVAGRGHGSGACSEVGVATCARSSWQGRRKDDCRRRGVHVSLPATK
jgi:hypothetical protein